MAELPSHFEYELKKPADKRQLQLYKFNYDQSQLAFSIGNSNISIAEFNPYTFFPEEDLDSEDEAIDLETVVDQYAVLPTSSGVIGCPKLHDWALEHQDILGQTREVMHAAFTALYKGDSEIPLDNDEHGFMGFAAGNRENWEGKPAGLHLQVFGNCACMGPSQNGLYIVDGMEHGFAQYELHNADLPAQQNSLYAGLGHLAKMASEA